MEQLIEKLRATQRKLETCLPHFTDPQKVDRLQALLLELRVLEERALFTSVDHVQFVRHLPSELSDFRVSADLSTDRADALKPTNEVEEKLAFQTLAERRLAEIKASASRILGNLLRSVEPISNEQIANLISLDSTLSADMKADIYDLVIKEYQDAFAGD